MNLTFQLNPGSVAPPAGNSHVILLVEDDEDDAFFLQRALRDAAIANPLRWVQDGQKAIEYLSGMGVYSDRAANPLPMVVFLDLKLPYKTGHQVLEWIRQQPEFAKLVVIVLTSSSEPVDLNRAYKAGANSYVVKPLTADQLRDLANAFHLAWMKRGPAA